MTLPKDLELLLTGKVDQQSRVNPVAEKQEIIEPKPKAPANIPQPVESATRPSNALFEELGQESNSKSLAEEVEANLKAKNLHSSQVSAINDLAGMNAKPILSDQVKVESKFLINSRSDLNQLVPFKYRWAWEKYLSAVKNEWQPQEVNMNDDIAQWKGNELSEAEVRIVKRSLGFFSTADSLVANNLVLAVYKHITAPECRQYLLRQAYEEAVHTHAYQYCIQSLNMDESEMFNMYRVIPSITNKAAWTLEHTRSLCDPDFTTEGLDNARTFLSNLIGFYCVVEGMFFYCGFAQILSMGRNNKMTGVAKQFEYILKDESMHLNFGIDLINAIIRENPELWDEDMRRRAKVMIMEGTALEVAYAHDTMPTPTVGLNSSDMEQYLKFIADRRLSQIGLSPEYHVSENPIAWMSEIIDLKKEQNFFEGTVTDYQTSALNWG